MKKFLIEKYLTEGKSTSQIISDIQKRGKKIANHFVDQNKAYFDLDGTTWLSGIGTAINQGPTKDFIKKVKSGKIRAKLLESIITEASGVGGSSELWFGSWSRALLIYVKENEVLWSYNHEFPPGYVMTDEDRQRARALGYILLDI